MSSKFAKLGLKNSRKLISSMLASVVLGVAAPCWAFPVDFVEMPLGEAFRSLGVVAGQNVVVSGDMRGTVTIHIDDTDFDTAMRAICAVHNLSYAYQDGMVIVGDQKKLYNQEFFKIKHLDPKTLKKQLEAIVESSEDITVDETTNTLSVMAAEPTLRRVEAAIKKLDVAQQQVTIQATIIELSEGKARELGLSFSEQGWTRQTMVNRRQSDQDNNGFIFGIAGKHEETSNWGKVWARPNVTVFDGHQAKVVMGDEVPVFTSTGSGSDSNANVNVEYKNVGVNLDVTPRINEADKDTVTMTIKPSVSTISQWVESGNNKAPQISTRSVDTVVRVKAGETILIAGLLKDDELKNVKAIPFLSKIPILGEFFKERSKSRSKTELVIALTPVIVKDSNGVPMVGMQTIKPSLHKELNTAQNEKVDYNLTSLQQANYEKSFAELKDEKMALLKTLGMKEQELSQITSASRDKDLVIAALKKERDALVEALSENNKAMGRLMLKLKEAGGQ